MTEKINLDGWKLRDDLEKIVNRNCEEVPWEGTNVNRSGIVNDIINYLKENHINLLKHSIKKGNE